ncbi:kunitz-type protease inhibitor 1-like [Crassostrea virginica]
MLYNIFLITTVVTTTFAGYWTSKRGDPCLSSRDPGPCRGSCPRYYFDSSDFTCKKFTYGCCGGNRNNYRTLEDCLDTCNDGCSNGINPELIRCIVGACTIQTCPNFPKAKCVPRCNSCFSQFIFRGRDVTSQCNTRKTI